jgi:hypothetical protein
VGDRGRGAGGGGEIVAGGGAAPSAASAGVQLRLVGTPTYTHAAMTDPPESGWTEVADLETPSP